MSKKNSSVNLKNNFKEFQDLSSIFLNFKSKLDSINKKKYLVAVSGGPDSLALVALTIAYTNLKKVKFHYVLVDHSIRKNSHQEAKKVKNILKKQKISLEIILNKKIITKNIQSEARNVRYEILKNYCLKKRITTILTAHNLEDQVETFFIGLSRGSGLKGLSAMTPFRKINSKVALCRPLLDVRKNFLIKISKKTFGKFVKDPSNKDEKYLRTKIRNLKKPLENSGIKYEQIFKSIQNLSFSRSTLDNYFEKIFKKLINVRNKEVSINFRKFNQLNDEVKIVLINQSIKKIKKNYYDVRSRKVQNLIKNLSKSNFKKSTLGGCIFFKKDGNLCLKQEKL